MTAAVATNTRVRVEAALAELGDTADAIADRLRAKEIKGVQDDSESCPVARYLHSVGFENAEVGTFSIWAGDDLTTMQTPLPVRSFVRAFDAGVYLDLVEQPEEVTA